MLDISDKAFLQALFAVTFFARLLEKYLELFHPTRFLKLSNVFASLPPVACIFFARFPKDRIDRAKKELSVFDKYLLLCILIVC